LMSCARSSTASMPKTRRTWARTEARRDRRRRPREKGGRGQSAGRVHPSLQARCASLGHGGVCRR
jgi:hypothetical protein